PAVGRARGCLFEEATGKQVRIPSRDHELWKQRPRHLHVDFLADVRAGGASGDAGKRRACSGVKRVAPLSEPIRVVAHRDRRGLPGGDIEPRTDVVDVAPAYLVGQSIFVVGCWVELVEGSTGTVRWRGIARRVVVFTGDVRRLLAEHRLADLPVAGPRAHGVG